MAEVNLNLMPFARMARIGAINSDMEALAQSVLIKTKDHKEGISAFRDKRKPEFRGE